MKMINNRLKKILCLIIVLLFSISIFPDTPVTAVQGNPDIPKITIGLDAGSQNLSPVLIIIIVTTVLAIAPSFLLLMTSFTRIVVVLSFVKQALGTRQAPPNQVVTTIALFLTIMIMFPIFSNCYTKAIVPYNNGSIGYEKATGVIWEEFKGFMLKEIIAHKNQDNITMLAQSLKYKINDINQTPFQILIPAFALSELEISFKMGILTFIPFIVVDMVVGSILLSMGMMMIPPAMVSFPFKMLLFVLVNGWDLIIGSLVRSFVGG